MIKRIISVLIACMMILPMSLISAYGANDINDLSDEYKNAADVLLAICPDMPYGTEGTYTRAEFAAAVVSLLNMPAKAESAGFLDVPSDHIYAKEIDMAVSLGLINSQNMFFPDAPITYVQAMKIAVSAAGYTVRADVLGGYPTGYLLAAKEANIGTGFNMNNDDILTYADGAALLYDMAAAEALQLTSLGDRVEYSPRDGQNILSLYRHIKIAEGLMDANEFTGLYVKNNTAGSNKISVDGVLFEGGDFYNLIGRNVRVFYNDDSKRTVIWAYATENNEQSFTAEYELDLSGNKITALSPDVAAKEQKLDLDSTYMVIYNGRNKVVATAAAFKSLIDIEAGSVTFVDNNGDRRYDVVCIEEITYGYIERVNPLGEKIYDKYQVSSTVDLSDPETKYYVFNSQGDLIDLEAIEANTPAGYVRSEDGKLVKIKLYDNAYGGTIEEKTSDNRLKIRDNYYELSTYYTAIKGLDDLKFGTKVICYLGEDNDIIYLEIVSGDVNYAYLVNCGVAPGSLNKEVIVKLMTPKQGMVELSLAAKTNINGNIRTTTQAITDLTAIMARVDKYRALKYSLNDEGKINKIFSAECVTDLSGIFADIADDDTPKAFLPNNESTGAGDGYIASTNSEGILTPFFVPAASCQVIMIPQEADKKLDDKEYAVLEAASFQADKTYNIIAYDVDAGGVPRFIMVYTNSSLTSIGEYTKYAIVEKKYTTVNDEGDVVDCIKAYTDGSYQQFYINEQVVTSDAVISTLDAVAPGDWVRLSYNARNEITDATHDYIIESKLLLSGASAERVKNSEHAFTGTNSGSWHECINGYIYGLSGNYARVVHKDTLSDSLRVINNNLIINLGRGSTVFVKRIRDRQGNVIEAQVYTEPDFKSIETIRNAGADADFVVTFQRFRQASLTAIYVD